MEAEFVPRTINDLLAKGACGLQDGQRWGKWVVDAQSLTLDYKEDGAHEEKYHIDLTLIDSSSQMLDWIIQVSEKQWCSREEVGNLVRALDEIFLPQQNLCSGGGDKRLADVEGFLRGQFAGTPES